MTTDDSLGELPELEPIDDAAPASPPPSGAAPPAPAPEAGQAARGGGAGLPAPAFNPNADKEYYRFLFAGIVMLVGCLMPFGPEWDMAGYKTLGGAFGLIVSLGMVWTWWGAIHTARFSGKNLKWVGLALIVFILQLMNLLRAWDAPAVVDWVANRAIPMPADTAAFFADLVNVNDGQAQLRADNFVRAYGPGKIVLLIGSLLAELFMIMAIFGGAKAAKAQKQDKQQAAAAKRAAAKSKSR